MGKGTAFNAPLIVQGVRVAPGAGGSSDVDAALSLFFAGTGIIDSRQSYNVGRAGAVGFAAPSAIAVIDAIPSALSAVSIAAAQVPVAGTPLTLIPASANGIIVTTAPGTGQYPSGNVAPAGSLFIDGLPIITGLGLDGFVGIWQPGSLLQRALQVTSVGNDSGAFVTISGMDYGGFPVTQRLALSNAGVATTTKTYKSVQSVVPSGSLSGSNISVGHADVYGFPMLCALFERADIYWSGALITASAGFVVADPTSPATQASGDTRGTYAVPSASNGTKRLVVYVTPSVMALTNSNVNQGLFGVPSV